MYHGSVGKWGTCEKKKEKEKESRFFLFLSLLSSS